MLAQLLPAEVFGFLLVFARVGGAIMLLPGFGESYISPRIRLAMALSITAVMYAVVRDFLPPLPAQSGALVVLVIGEVIYGLFLGGSARLILSALHVAGLVISFLSGLSYAQTVDPAQGMQGAIVGALLTLVGTMAIFASGLHAVLLGAIHDSYILFPVGAAPPTAGFAQLAIGLVAGAFALGVQIAAPFLVYGLVFYIGLGMLQRLIPQVQLFFIAIPLQILFAFVVLAMVISSAVMLFLNHFEAGMTSLLLPR